MFKGLSDEMKKTILETLYKRYDEINAKLNRDFLRVYYDDWEIVEMREQLEKLDILIKEIKEG